ncbi:unnamed protein product [Oppiella nova]|uniref:Protein kinase domain-containing protein n=1 Tax=Oppiella nova TaxID=334625 RepID=A0A7R9QTM8_9ACAR|nr:unnamed protein product [Oppiella nova]CAG2173566.1 unnamed protein product [Oppiella nova]
MDHTHPQIIHRDLKPDNILIADNVKNVHDKRVHYRTTQKHTADVGDMKYMAPESNYLFLSISGVKPIGSSVANCI